MASTPGRKLGGNEASQAGGWLPSKLRANDSIDSSTNAGRATRPSPSAGEDPLRTKARQLGELVVQRSLDRSQIEQYTQSIAETVLSRSRNMRSVNFTSTSSADLKVMAELYDEKFFDAKLLALARHFHISFRWSSRMTSAGGKTIRSTHRPRGTKITLVTYEIALSSTLLFQTFGDLDRPIRVTGFLCTNRMQAMQRILEHELIHLAEMLVWDDSNCSAPRFQTIAQRFFGHTEHRHELVTQLERAAKKYNIVVGSIVAFEFEGQRYIGKVNRITRRATILVADQKGQRYTDGRLYRKFYVPLAHLIPV